MKLTNPTLSQLLQIGVASHYTVSAVDAQKAYEEFEDSKDGTLVTRFIAYAFAVIARDRHDDARADDELATALRQALVTAWPTGTQVMWRLRPVFENDTLGRIARCRLAATIPPPVDHYGYVKDGFPPPVVDLKLPEKVVDDDQR